MSDAASGKYGVVARLFHWSAAAALIFMVATGLVMADMPRGPEKNELIRLHASSGLALFTLTAARLAWRFVAKPPAPPAGASAAMVFAAGAVHAALYALVFAQVATGVMSLFTVAWNIPFFGLFEIPTPYVERDMAAHKLWDGRHSLLFWTLAGLVALHALAAVYHQFVRRDGLLRRMTF